MIAAVVPYAGEPVDVLNATLQSCGNFAEFAVIAVDGAPLDESEIDADGFTVHVHRIPGRRGCPAAMNAGVRAAEHLGATRIGRCDTGDEWRAGMREVLRDTAPAAFGCSQYPVLIYWDTRLWADNQFQASCTAFDVDVWRGVGGYDESLRFADDWDFAIKVQSRVGWEYVPGSMAAIVDASGVSAPGDRDKERQRAHDHAIVARRAQRARRARR